MSIPRISLLALAFAAMVGAGASPVEAGPGQGNDPNVVMLDACSPADPAWNAVGGCPEGSGPGFAAYRGDVTFEEFLDFLFTPLGPADLLIGHPAWRHDPSYLTVRDGQTVRVTNRGGRVHTFTEVEEYGGGFVPLLNGALTPVPECGADEVPNSSLVFVPFRQTQRLTGLESGLHKFQCCIHPWMRAAIRVE